MGPGGDRDRRGGGRDQSTDGGAREDSLEQRTGDLRLLLMRRRAARARALKSAADWNRAHPEAVAKFNRLTKGACEGPDGSVDVSKVRTWQANRHIIVDGAIGETTIAAAEREVNGESAPKLADLEQTPDQKRANGGMAPDVAALFRPTQGNDQTFEPAVVEGRPNAFAGEEVGDRVIGDEPAPESVHDAAEERKDRNEAISTWLPEGVEHTARTFGVVGEEPPKFEVPDGVAKSPEFETVKRAEAAEERAHLKGTLAVKGVNVALAVPRLVDLLRDHDYARAVKLIVDACTTWEERAKLLRMALGKVAAKVAPWVADILEKAITLGAITDVLGIGFEWVMTGFESLHRSKEEGEKAACIRIYADAWARAVMDGLPHDNAGAVTAEERQAVRLGGRAGVETHRRYPELPALLSAELDGNPIKVRLALEMSLLKAAGDTDAVGDSD